MSNIGSNTGNTTKDWRDSTGEEARRLAGLVRRMAVRVTSAAFWQVVGHILLDGTQEAVDAEVYSGVGFYSRPAASANAEAIVVHPGGAANPAIVGTRDEALRKKMAGSAGQDFAAMFNSQAIVQVDPDGKIRAHLPGGAAVELALTTELNNLRAFVVQQFAGAGHTHAVSGSVTTAVTPVVLPVPSPASNYPGTQVLKGQ